MKQRIKKTWENLVSAFKRMGKYAGSVLKRFYDILRGIIGILG